MRVAVFAALAAAALAAAACSGTSTDNAAGAAVPSPGPLPPLASATPAGNVVTMGTGASSSGANWTQYDGNAARTGVATGVPRAGALKTAWSARLDGAVYGQPLVVGDAVIVATENDSLYALNRGTGKVIWARNVGTAVPQSALHCGDIFPLGITGTPIYDQGNGEVYAVAEITGYQHVLVAVDAATGAVKLRRALDQPTPSNQPDYNQQRPALAIAGGRVYAAFGGLSGDCGAYQGGVISAPLAGDGPLASWHTPTSREGAVWGTGGPVVGPNGDLWVSNGNGAAGTGDPYDGSDSVSELSPSLRRVAYFAPSGWAADNENDQDLGSTQPALAAGGAVFIMGKRSVGYLLSETHPGGIGGQLAQQVICNSQGTMAVSGSVVYAPCRNGGGMAAIQVSAASKTIKVLWRGPAGTGGSPVIGGGAVFVTDWSGATGILYELNESTGKVEQRLPIAAGLPHFDSMALSGGTAYVSTLSGVTAVDGA
jgi:outer membrane protein assembly factor BamB